MTHAYVNLLLTLPDCDGWHDRLHIWVDAKGCHAFAVHTRLGSRPLTRQALEDAVRTRAGSLHPVDVSGRKEQRKALR